MVSTAEMKAGYSAHPLSVAADLINIHLKSGRSIADIQTPANEYFAQFKKPGETVEMALERFARPIDILGISESERGQMEHLEGYQSLALASLITQNLKHREVYEFAVNEYTREKFRFLLDKTLLHDFAHLQHGADEAEKNNDLELAGSLQPRANQMLELRTKLLAKAHPTESAPTPGQ